MMFFLMPCEQEHQGEDIDEGTKLLKKELGK
jgi:hypothetical protein